MRNRGQEPTKIFVDTNRSAPLSIGTSASRKPSVCYLPVAGSSPFPIKLEGFSKNPLFPFLLVPPPSLFPSISLPESRS